MYRRSTGKDRSEALIVAENVRRFEAGVERKLARKAALIAERDEEVRARWRARGR